jgi:hypothetical protein
VSRRARHLVTPRADVALYHNVWISFGAPIVLAQSSELSLATGVARATSLTFAGGLLPAGGFDAQAPGMALAGDLVFRGISRSGVPELRGGLGWAPMNQALDDTKPTWKLGVEGRFAIGRVMQFNAANPASETGVSTGVHELRLWTSVDRRFRYFEGWFEASFRQPIATAEGSLFQDPGFGARTVRPGPVASAAFGIETFVIDNPNGNRFSVDVGGRLTTHFEGRGYSEMWEVFALAGAPGGPLALDADPVTGGVQPLVNPGVTTIESYLEASGKLALRARLGPHVTLSAVGELIWKSNHVISFTDAGVDLPTCAAGGGTGCEIDNNDLVSPGTQEVNPLHAQPIDLVGHRYHAVDNRGIVLGAEVQILF